MLKTASIFCGLLTALALISTATAAEPPILSPDARVAGKSQAEWSAAWWQWAGSFDRQDSPIADTSGEKCRSSQDGPVFFLAGTYGTKRTVRTCAIPHGKYLFFPLINYVFMPGSDKDCDCTCDTSKIRARLTSDRPAMLLLDIDGRRVDNLEAYRQATGPCFDMGARTPQKYKVYPSAANGYYVMLPPLQPGKHVLNFGGALPGMLQAVTYTLEVE